MNIKWDADKYTSDFSFVHRYGNGVIDLIDGNCGTVLDLGCGNGALSKVLSDKGFHVVGIDASGELLEIAKKNYPEIRFMKADAAEFSLRHPVDVVFSNAVFHWINGERQRDMLKCVHEALKENGQFVFEFGGYGNNRLIHGALKTVLFDRPTELKGGDGLKDWINMFVKAPFSVVKNEDEKRKIIDETVENLRNVLYRDGKWFADYVRIRMKAVRL